MRKADSSYATLHFLVRHGGWLAPLTGVVPVVVGGLAWVAWGVPGYFAVGVLIGAFVFLLMRSYVELVRLIVEMLLPK